MRKATILLVLFGVMLTVATVASAQDFEEFWKQKEQKPTILVWSRISDF